MLCLAKWLLLATATSLVVLQSLGQQNHINFNGLSHQQIASEQPESTRQGKHLLDWIGLGTGPDQDPYVARTNAACLNGDFAECFKSQALNSFGDFFNKEQYDLSANARIVRMPVDQLRSLAYEPYEFASEARADDSEWDHLVKFAMRKVEKFLKSTALELHIPDDVTENGRYSPRFVVDEIADEIDIIEDKKDTLFSRKRLRKLFIPFLIVLKLFKLKLLLFLPLILGLASFKKLLAFLAIIVPGVIGFFKLCKPDIHGSASPFANVPQYAPNGLGAFHSAENYLYGNTRPVHVSHKPQYYGESVYGHGGYHRENGVSFHDGPQNLAYSGYSEYRSAKSNVETSSKKSILPDS